MKQRLELHVMPQYIDLARHHIGWDAVLSEELEYKGDGVWHSTGVYYIVFDDVAIQNLKGFVEERMEKYFIRECYVEIVNYED